MIRRIIGTDDDFEESTEKLLKAHKNSHKKFTDKFRKQCIDNDND